MTPEEELDSFLARYTDDIAGTARIALAKLRARLPGAVQLVYDNYNALVIGFGPSERASEAWLSIALYPKWVTLFFLYGAGLPDPERRLKGAGKQVRHVVLRPIGILDDPSIRALIDHAMDMAKVPMEPSQPGRLVIRSISPKQRPRRPAKSSG